MVRLLLPCLAGCVKVAVTATPATLARHASDFANHGYARVEVEEGGTIIVESATIVGDLTVGTIAASPHVLPERPVHVGMRNRFDARLFGVGAFGLAGVIAGGACLAICSGPPEGVYVGTALATGMLLYSLSTTF